jgi:hypothetical protein
MLSLTANDLDEMAVALAADIARAEVEVVGTVLADHPALLPVAEREGVTPSAFGQEDVRLIYAAADVSRDRRLAEVLWLARAALRRAHHWDPQGPIGTGCMWSDETLVRLAGMFPASVVATRYHARHLLALSRRWRMAEDLLRQFREVLAGESEAAPVLPARLPVVTVIRKGKRGAA